MPKRGKVALGIIIAIAIVSFIGPFIVAYTPDAINLDSIKTAPSVAHPFGTDQKGRDILARVLEGGRISLSVALIATIISMSAGLVVGLVSGYFGGRLDTALMSLVDLVLSFPSLLLAIGISIILPAGIFTSMTAIASVGWASFARLIRGHVLSLRESAFVDSARVIGAGDFRILIVHILPQCMPLLLAMAGLKSGGFILTEASLSFLGLGAQPPMASWGSMISAGRAYILSSPWMAIAPGIAIATTTLCLNVLGDAVSERYGLRENSR